MKSNNLNWLKKFLAAIPEGSKRLRSILEIASVSNLERVNSNLLGFYLNENEEHGLGRVFLDAVIELAVEKQEARYKVSDELSTECEFAIESEECYNVELEVQTIKGNYIDIVVTSDQGKENNLPSWAVIIENKIWSKVKNDLADYAMSVQASKKLRILLSVWPVSERDSRGTLSPNGFVNILHRDIIKRVKQKLKDFWAKVPDRHLAFLKEYFNYIDSLYPDPQHIRRMDKALQQFQQHPNEIKSLLDLNLKVQEYVREKIAGALDRLGYRPATKGPAMNKHYISKDGWEAEHFRFWVKLENFRFEPFFYAVYELHGRENTIRGEEVRKRLRDIGIHNENVTESTRGAGGDPFTHLYWINIPINLVDGKTLLSVTEEQLRTQLFEHPNRFIQTAIEVYREVSRK